MTQERSILADWWMEKQRAAYEVYRRARDYRQQIQDEAAHLPQADGGYAFRRALIAESNALVEYRHALGVHYQIIVSRKRPE